MAQLTTVPAVGADPGVPFALDLKQIKVKVRQFSGAGTTATVMEAAPGAGLRHVVISLECSQDGGTDTLQILSAANVLRTIPFPVKALAVVNRRIEMNTNEALSIKKTGATDTVYGEIRWVTIADGGDCPTDSP